MGDGPLEFSTVRSLLWPVHRHELKKFLLMAFLFFLISFNYHFLRITKDVLIITAPQSGAEVIPFLKVWFILPAAIIMTALFTTLSNWFSRENIFYVMIGIFMGFFLLFLFVLYPLREQLFLHSFADRLQQLMPAGLGGMIAIIRYWTLALFYIFAELWSTIMVSLLLWGLANDVTSVNEAKRFYALFGIGINSAGILAGQVGAHLSHVSTQATTSTWDQIFTVFVVIVIISGFLSIIIHRWLHISIFTSRHTTPNNTVLSNGKKMSLLDSVRYIARSRYLISIVIIVLAYNLIINLTEVLWKSQMKELCPNPQEYANYMSTVTFYIGILATLGSFFISGNIIRRLGWRWAALATPAIVSFTGIFFFYYLFLKQYGGTALFPAIFAGLSPLTLVVTFGSIQNCLTRSAKYTVFDDTKEMAFIPLGDVVRFKGKSAIDGVGSRLGKSGSSFMLQILFIIFGNPAAATWPIACIMAVVVPIWIWAINNLAIKFERVSAVEPAPILEGSALVSRDGYY